MTKRLQAYFRTEDEAEGAKTALIPYAVEGLEVSSLTDPLDQGGNTRRNILIPLVPFNNSSVAGSGVGAAGAASGTLAGTAIVPGIVRDDGLDSTDEHNEHDTRSNAVLSNNDDPDLDNLHYVMELKVPEEQYNDVVHALRGKRAYVEVFE